MSAYDHYDPKGGFYWAMKPPPHLGIAPIRAEPKPPSTHLSPEDRAAKEMAESFVMRRLGKRPL